MLFRILNTSTTPDRNRRYSSAGKPSIIVHNKVLMVMKTYEQPFVVNSQYVYSPSYILDAQTCLEYSGWVSLAPCKRSEIFCWCTIERLLSTFPLMPHSDSFQSRHLYGSLSKSLQNKQKKVFLSLSIACVTSSVTLSSFPSMYPWWSFEKRLFTFI